MNKKTIKFIHWSINRSCNYNCSYCISVKRKRIPGINPSLLLPIFKKHLKGCWCIQFSGSGEPFLTPDFLKIVEELIKMGHKIGVITNFSSSLEDLKKFCKITENRLFEFVASLHLEDANVDEFIKKAKIVNKLTNGILGVRSVAVKDRVAEIHKIGERFKKHGIYFDLQLQRNYEVKQGADYDPYINYNKKEKAILNNLGKFHYSKNDLKFKGKKCWAGVRYFTLDEDGEVWQCLPAKCCKLKEGCLGNILDKSFSLRKRAGICGYKHCYCSAAFKYNIVN